MNKHLLPPIAIALLVASMVYFSVWATILTVVGMYLLTLNANSFDRKFP